MSFNKIIFCGDARIRWTSFKIFRCRTLILCFLFLNTLFFTLQFKRWSNGVNWGHENSKSTSTPKKIQSADAAAKILQNFFAPIKTTTNDPKMNKRFTWTSRVTCEKFEKVKKNSVAIIVHSARSHFGHRRQIRDTWGEIKFYKNWTISTIAFMVGGQGQIGEESFVPEMMEIEQDTYGDLVTRDFVDSYRNLTLKSIMSFEWLTEFCPRVKIVVKVDDDVVINIFELIKTLEKNPNHLATQSKFHCVLMKKSLPYRNESHKWYVSPAEYPGEIFPPYCGGAGWLASMRVVEKILGSVHWMRKPGQFFWIDDIFMTGIMPAYFNSRMRQQQTKKKAGDVAEFIGHVDRKSEWFYSPANFESSTKELLIWLHPLGKSDDEGGKTEKNKIDAKFATKIFFVIEHGPNFSSQFLASWTKIVSLYK